MEFNIVDFFQMAGLYSSPVKKQAALLQSKPGNPFILQAKTGKRNCSEEAV